MVVTSASVYIRISKFRGLDLNSKAKGFPLVFNRENKSSLTEAQIETIFIKQQPDVEYVHKLVF